jgi:hypothetical protein
VPLGVGWSPVSSAGHEFQVSEIRGLPEGHRKEMWNISAGIPTSVLERVFLYGMKFY